jgi:hypothetical protein
MQRFDRQQGKWSNPWILCIVLSAAGIVGCSSSAGLGVGDKGIATARSRTIDHEPCDLESKTAERVDANGDGKPDLTVVRDGQKEICRAADLDFDGRIDVWTYLDATGKLRRRELDYDRDGTVDEIQLFKAGEISEKHRASTPAKRLDTWEFYSAGRLVRAERDSDADGRVDQWWDYKTPDCPVIRADVDGNGEPDPKTEVDYCKESGYKPPEQAVPTAAPMLQKETQALPTETSNKPESEDGAGSAASSGASANQKSKGGDTKATSDKASKSPASGKGDAK